MEKNKDLKDEYFLFDPQDVLVRLPITKMPEGVLIKDGFEMDYQNFRIRAFAIDDHFVYFRGLPVG